MSWNPEKSSKAIEARVKALQNNYTAYFETLPELYSTHEKVRVAGKNYKAEIKPYVEYYDALKMIWVKEESLNDAMQVAEVQQNVCSYIELLAKQDKIHEDILSKGKKCKNIIAPYVTYFKELDRAWENKESVAAAAEVISLQEKILKILDMSGLEGIDKEVKKQKITTLDGLFKYIQAL